MQYDPGNLIKVNTPFVVFNQYRLITGPYQTLQLNEHLIILSIVQEKSIKYYLLLSADNKRVYNIQLLSQSSYNEFISCTSKLS